MSDPEVLQRQKLLWVWQTLHTPHGVCVLISPCPTLWGEGCQKVLGPPGGWLLPSPIQVSPKGRCSSSRGHEERCCSHADLAHLPVPPSSEL